MAQVKPFAGLLYADTRPESIARVLAPPFDMVSPDDQERLFAESESNIAWVTVARWGADPGYREAGARFADWRARGVFAPSPAPAFYVYEQTVGKADPVLPRGAHPTRLGGFLAAARIADAEGAGIYPHENTFEGPIRDRVELTEATSCHLEPVFGIYTDQTRRAEAVLERGARSQPIWETTLRDGSQHRLWALTDPAEQAVLEQVLAACPVVIADGHHRFAGAKAYRDKRRAEGGVDPEAPYEYALMFLADTEASGLRVGAFHRLVRSLPPTVGLEQLSSRLAEQFAVRDLPVAASSDEETIRALLADLASAGGRGPVFGCVLRDRGLEVRPRDLAVLMPKVLPPGEADMPLFDVALLHRAVLKPVLGLTGEYGPEARNVLFEHDPLAAWRAARSGAAAMAWFVNPANARDVMRTALAHHRVPQKATYFHPKPPSGMVLYELR
jgi:uncharacterized protein (DUF1015 family)